MICLLLHEKLVIFDPEFINAIYSEEVPIIRVSSKTCIKCGAVEAFYAEFFK
jgi:hypothetical protein